MTEKKVRKMLKRNLIALNINEYKSVTEFILVFIEILHRVESD